MFARMGTLPTFRLHAAGVGAGYFWRSYQLKASGMTCEIHETFDGEALDGKVLPRSVENDSP